MYRTGKHNGARENREDVKAIFKRLLITRKAIALPSGVHDSGGIQIRVIGIRLSAPITPSD
jgi:hypothetical protein